MSSNKTPLKIIVGLIAAGGAAVVACSACCLPLVGILAAGVGISSVAAAVNGWYLTAAGILIVALVVIGFRLKAKSACKPLCTNKCANTCNTAIGEEQNP